MVRRRVGKTLTAALVALVLWSCGRQRDMSDSAEMPDSAPVMRALENDAAMDSMLDTMPGGEMVRGDSAASERLLREKLDR